MTTFPDPSPSIERVPNPRDTSHINDSARRVAYPAGPVPGDRKPSEETERMPGATEPGAPGLPAVPKS
jgi:hypothetical protein